MSEQALIVVGNKFHEFTKVGSSITFSQLTHLAQLPSQLVSAPQQLIPGLGVRRDHYQQLIRRLQKRQHPEKNNETEDADLLPKFYQGESQPNALTHQRSLHNVLIGQATKLTEQCYRLPLIIDERCLLLGDHQTGSHVQGMVIIEAFRQAFIAITEEFYLSSKQNDHYFIINQMNTQFEHFAFPLPAQIQVNVVNVDNNEHRLRLEMQLQLEQAQHICAQMTSQFSVYAINDLVPKEQALAKQALSFYLSPLKGD